MERSGEWEVVKVFKRERESKSNWEKEWMQIVVGKKVGPEGWLVGVSSSRT